MIRVRSKYIDCIINFYSKYIIHAFNYRFKKNKWWVNLTQWVYLANAWGYLTNANDTFWRQLQNSTIESNRPIYFFSVRTFALKWFFTMSDLVTVQKSLEMVVSLMDFLIKSWNIAIRKLQEYQLLCFICVYHTTSFKTLVVYNYN